jgi:DNA polymerase III delta prime subunit
MTKYFDLNVFLETKKMLFTEKYTPKFFNDFKIDNLETISLLKHFIKINFGNMLFIGPSGCGKTLFIEVLLNEFFVIHNKKQGTYINDHILRINVLREQGINFYRNDLKHFCQNISSTQKFVIMEDMENLNEQSQQVICSSIQKYSHSIHFIGTCSNPQKLNNTLNTLLLPIQFHGISYELMEKMYDTVTKNESININTEAKLYILQTRRNPKALLNDLQKCKLYTGYSLHSNQIDIHTIKDILCDINDNTFDLFTQHVRNKNILIGTQVLFALYQEGFSVIDILSQYYNYIKHNKDMNDALKYEITKVLTKYITIFHNVHEDSIELALFTNNLVEIF